MINLGLSSPPCLGHKGPNKVLGGSRQNGEKEAGGNGA